jgi:hypothetical protein
VNEKHAGDERPSGREGWRTIVTIVTDTGGKEITGRFVMTFWLVYSYIQFWLSIVTYIEEEVMQTASD